MSLSFHRTLLLGLSLAAVTAQAGDAVWQRLINENCSPTLRGSVSRMTDERGFWVKVNVEMHFWAEEQRAWQGPTFCRGEYQHPSQVEERARCINTYRARYDWYNRCKPVVVMMCRRAGGFCTNE